MKTVAALTWQDQSDPNAPLAPYTLDFGTDQNWVFSSLDGSYTQKRISPAGVIVDNSQNTQPVTITCGVLTLSVNAVDRQAIDLPKGAASISFSCSSNTQKTPIAFYVKKPAPDAQGLNYLLAQQTVQAAIAATTLGTMNPIINSEFRIWPEGTSFAGTGAAIYTAEGWQFKGSANMTCSQQQGIITSQNAMRMQRNAGSADVTALQCGTTIETADSYQYAGQTAVVSFDMRVGADFSAANLTVQIITGTGTDENAFKPLTGLVTVGTLNFAKALSGTRVNGTAALPVPGGATQVGLLFSYTPTGVAGANDWADISRVKLDVGSLQSYTPVPLEIEKDRCERYFEILNSEQLANYDFGVGFSAGASLGGQINLRYKTKRAIPSIVYINSANGFEGLNFSTASTATLNPASPISKECADIRFTTAGAFSTDAAITLQSKFSGGTGGQIKINARM